jgi:hypothetical protein
MVGTRGVGRAVSMALVLVALLGSPNVVASSVPMLRPVTQEHGHILVRFTVGDLRPWLVEVAVSASTDASGEFLGSDVRLRERVTAGPDPISGIVRWRTRGVLPAGVYYVEVSGIESDGVTDCRPQERNCLVHWSNVRRVLVR